jgi:hypothetical protein
LGVGKKAGQIGLRSRNVTLELSQTAGTLVPNLDAPHLEAAGGNACGIVQLCD